MLGLQSGEYVIDEEGVKDGREEVEDVNADDVVGVFFNNVVVIVVVVDFDIIVVVAF